MVGITTPYNPKSNYVLQASLNYIMARGESGFRLDVFLSFTEAEVNQYTEGLNPDSLTALSVSQAFNKIAVNQ